jgi:EmrB/QacA subfamily drug resistance transporter
MQAAGATPAKKPGGSGLDPAVLRIAFVVVLGSIMSVLDTTIVTVAINTLRRDFHSSLATIQWVSTGYLLALAMVIPLSGWSIERFGTKRVWMCSAALFLVGSVMCGLSWSILSLICFRVLQGIGGGMLMPAGQTILAREAGPDQMGRVMSVIGIPMLLGPIIGPTLGGLIIVTLSWRWIFFVNVPIGIVALVRGYRILHPGEHHLPGRLDIRGFCLLSPGLALLLYGLSSIGTGTIGLKVVLILAAAVLLIILFIRHSLGRQNSLVDLQLFANRTLRAASSTSFVVGGTIFGVLFIIPLYYQIVRGQSPLVAGLLLAPQELGAMVSMRYAGRFTDRYGAGRIVPFGVLLVVIGSIPYTQVTPHTSELVLAASLLVRGLGLGATAMPAMAAGYATLQRDAIPRATTLLSIIQRVGSTLGTAVLAVILQRETASQANSGTASFKAVANGTAHISGPALTSVAHAFAATFWFGLGLSALAIIPALYLPRQGATAAADRAPPDAIPIPEL